MSSPKLVKMQRPRSQEIFGRATDVLVGGVNSPVRAFRAVGGEPIIVDRAAGARLWDADGNEYIDYVCSWGALILGHAHPNVMQAINEQARHGPYFSLTRVVGGRTRSRRLTAQQAERVRQQLAAGQEFRRQLEAYWQASETWAEAELEQVAAAEAAEKRGSKQRSTRNSPARSKPS